jgi:hypothetical protein
MWSDGGPAQPSPTIGQAVNGGFPWFEVKCSRCRTANSIDLTVINGRPRFVPGTHEPNRTKRQTADTHAALFAEFLHLFAKPARLVISMHDDDDANCQQSGSHHCRRTAACAFPQSLICPTGKSAIAWWMRQRRRRGLLNG